ncbi:MAG: alpha/beta hydrolase [Prevotellaceae bacterium]|jgi:pimeloyl-ACP methyl ester carboxylesterase|nr:alpha/beta hydrolase [Prevotellaceae bacterium]
MLHYKTIINENAAEWLVFIHGFGGSSTIFCKQIQPFAKTHNLLLVDLKGHGKSSAERHSRNYSYSEIAKDVIEVLDYLSLGECHFVGCSLGTIVVREIAELKPSLVKTMTMAGAVVRFNIRSKLLMTFARFVRRFVPYMWIYCIYSKILMPHKRHKQSRQLFIVNAMKMCQREFARWLSMTANLSSLLRFFRTVELEIPTLYLMGDEDYMFLPQVRHLIQSHNRFSTLVVVPNSGHVCNIDNADFFNKKAMSFLVGAGYAVGAGRALPLQARASNQITK